MYMMQQQQQQQITRTMYPRQQAPMGSIETMQHGSTEWRHMMMSQQQSTNFNNMRPNFQQSKNSLTKTRNQFQTFLFSRFQHELRKYADESNAATSATDEISRNDGRQHG